MTKPKQAGPIKTPWVAVVKGSASIGDGAREQMPNAEHASVNQQGTKRGIDSTSGPDVKPMDHSNANGTNSSQSPPAPANLEQIIASVIANVMTPIQEQIQSIQNEMMAMKIGAMEEEGEISAESVNGQSHPTNTQSNRSAPY